MTDIDWQELYERAIAVSANAYAPYSRYPVGAAARTTDGRVIVGCNVENAALGVVLCAECGIVSQLAATGGGRLAAVLCVNADGKLILPCGRCRQLLWEHGGAGLLLQTPKGTKTLNDLLPDGFGREDLEQIEEP